MSLLVRPLTPADLEAADEIAVAAYGGPRRRRSELARYLALQPDGWALAVYDGRPAGLGGAVVYGPFAYIGLMAVHPALQRQGIARAIMDYLLTWLREQRCPVALLDASAAGQPLYTSLGFMEDDEVVAFMYEESGAPPIATREVCVAGESDLTDLAAFDAAIFGASRQRMLASYLADGAGRAFLTRDAAGTIDGYLIGQEHTLGPWMARSPQDAEALLAHALALPFAESLRVLVPAANRDAPRLLERCGFKAQRTLSHMRLGEPRSPVHRALVYGQASFALG